jgi:hypothetical protein
MSSAAPTMVPVRKIRLRQIGLPTEHGGWGFLLEPIVAGLAIAWSTGGIWIAVMVIGSFLTRQPLKVFITDRLGMRNANRAAAAIIFCLIYSAIFAVGLTTTIAIDGTQPLLPFALVLPLIIFQIYNDVSRKSRQLIPELTGAVSISASIAAIALASGQSWMNAASLWLIFVARLVPSILYVRHRLLLEKGKEFSRVTPTMAHIAAVLVVSILAYCGLSPFSTVFAMLMLLYRSVSGLSPNRGKMRAMQIGVREVIYGSIVVLTVIVGYYAKI